MQNLLRTEAYPTVPQAALGDGPWLSTVSRLFGQLNAAVDLWAVRSSTRRALAELEPYRLADIGKTVAEARRESAKPFWRA